MTNQRTWWPIRGLDERSEDLKSLKLCHCRSDRIYWSFWSCLFLSIHTWDWIVITRLQKHTIVCIDLNWPVLAWDPCPVVLDGDARVEGDLGSLPVVNLVGMSLRLAGGLRESINHTGTCALWCDSSHASQQNCMSARCLLKTKLAHLITRSKWSIDAIRNAESFSAWNLDYL